MSTQRRMPGDQQQAAGGMQNGGVWGRASHPGKRPDDEGQERGGGRGSDVVMGEGRQGESWGADRKPLVQKIVWLVHEAVDTGNCVVGL